MNAMFNALYFFSKSARTLTQFIFATNARNNYGIIVDRTVATVSTATTVPTVRRPTIATVRRVFTGALASR